MFVVPKSGEIAFSEADALHCSYEYTTESGETFELWDARTELGRVPFHVASPQGELAHGTARSPSRPDHWRHLRVGESRVLVALTETTARIAADVALTMAEQEGGERFAKLTARYASRSEAVEGVAQAYLSAGIADVQPVTRGLIEMFEAAAAAATAAATAAPGPKVIVVPSSSITIEYASRTGKLIDEAEWKELRSSPQYSVLASDRVVLPNTHGQLALEVTTLWVGAVLNGDSSRLFLTRGRARHNCSAPESECEPCQWHGEGFAATEQEALHQHAVFVAEMRRLPQTEAERWPAAEALAEALREAGLPHLPPNGSPELEAAYQRIRARNEQQRGQA